MTPSKVATIAKRAVMKTVETKKHSTNRTETSFSFATFVDDSLVNIGQGTGNSSRIGHKINSMGFDVRGHINTASGTARTIFKMMLIRFKNNDADPSLDLIESNTADISPLAEDVPALYRRINTDDYEVLRTKYVSVNPDRPFQMFKFWVPYKRSLTYNGGATQEPTHNRVHLVAFAREVGNDAVSPNVEFTYNATLYYKDP